MIRLYLNRGVLAHDTGPTHPERKGRLEPLMATVEATSPPGVEILRDFPPATMEELLACHSASYLERFQKALKMGESYLDTVDCPLSTGTWAAALLSAGGSLHAVKSILTGEIQRAFCALRPPGHHSLSDRAMGFCYFNNAALAAHAALSDPAVERVAILDWDAHHGNGTQALFYDRDDLLYVSLHGDPAITYPGTGLPDETGEGAGEGFTLNLPQPAGVSVRDYLEVFESQAIAVLETYRPDLIIVSCGYDGHTDDPLVPNLALDDTAFLQMAEAVTALADTECEGRILFLLEGGYNPEVLTRLTLGILDRALRPVSQAR